ncbi:phage tail protein [Dokdonia sinensis]|uniref:Phage tail protein n=1 Tax=Dokdonia sinensis TaxID=2479847 RepID=A0A3M0FUK7_9FLAO|nr:phage tail protein [Dokdonia sinensis]RMB56175.1 phage tail protein [Dokdonia sinensis]
MADTNFMTQNATPSTEFYFKVSFEGRSDMDSSFQEVSGLNVTLETQPVIERVENRFVHELPTQPTFSNLVLKRCLILNSHLEKWCKDALEKSIFDPMNIRISLMNKNEGSLASWHFDSAYPISWELSTLHSNLNELAIEALELKYRHFKRER